MNVLEHLLTCVAEEGCEIGQAAHKAQRFGLEDTNPKTGNTNRQDLVAEVNDLLGALELLQEHGVDLSGLFDRAAIDAKKAKIITWMGHAEAVGTLQRGDGLQAQVARQQLAQLDGEPTS